MRLKQPLCRARLRTTAQKGGVLRSGSGRTAPVMERRGMHFKRTLTARLSLVGEFPSLAADLPVPWLSKTQISRPTR